MKLFKHIKRYLKLRKARKNRDYWAKVTDQKLVEETADPSCSMEFNGQLLESARAEKAHREHLREIRHSVSSH